MNADGGMTMFARAVSAAFAAVVALTACGDNVTPPVCCDAGPEPDSAVVSEPLAPGASGASPPLVSLKAPSASAAGTSSAPAAERLVYVSLPSGAYPAGTTAIIRNTSGGPRFAQPMRDGGFDPVAIPAGVGDTVEISVRAGATVLASIARAVPRRRPPGVVRTNPPRGKKDVALNGRITIIFSEPVDASTVTASSISLTRNGTPIAGSVQVFAGGLAAEFVPSVPLASSAAHRLLITRNVRDVEGDALQADVSVEFATGTTTTPPVTSVEVTPSEATLEVGDVLGDSVQLAATVRTALSVLTNREVIWSTSDPSVAVVSSRGLVKARTPGLATITATSEGRTDSAQITVVPIPVARVEIGPLEPTVEVGGTVFVGVGVFDRNGQILTRRAVILESDNTGIATVDQRGLVAGISPGTVTITATSEGVSGTTTIEVGGILLVDRVEVDPAATALAVGATVQLRPRVYRCDAVAKSCTESNEPRVTWFTANSSVASVTETGKLTAVSAGAVEITALVGNLRGTAAITVLSAPLTFTSVIAGYYFTCGLTAAGKAYCWGQNPFGELGIGMNAPLAEWRPAAVAPVPVSGGITFASISVGGWHACGLTSAGAAYCWGLGLQRQLGQSDGEAVQDCEWSAEQTVQCAVAPTPVSGAPPFRALYAGGLQTCALTANGTAYCWGGDRYGQLGDGGGATAHGLLPTPVAGNHTFASLSPGSRYVCGLTTQAKAYCWGWNFNGQLGDGSNVNRDVPVPVEGDLSFASLSALGDHTCGVTTTGEAYCWGDNYYGQLGDGTRASSNLPVAVRGGPFTWVGVGEFHSCGLTIGGTVECWGANWFGELGSGPGPSRSTPLPVAGGLAFATLRMGASHACGLTTGQIAYCWGLNQSGQLGDGTATRRNTPVRVLGQP